VTDLDRRGARSGVAIERAGIRHRRVATA